MKYLDDILLLTAGLSMASVISRTPLSVDLSTFNPVTDAIAACSGSSCSGTPLIRRAVKREKCGPPSLSDVQRRGFGYVDRPNYNETIESRAMRLPAPDGTESIRNFIMRETDNEFERIPFAWTYGNENGGEGRAVNTALYRDFTKERSLVTTSLRGCTVLAVVSRKGAYMGHYWESISFDPEDIERGEFRDKSLETNDELFERTVIKGLEKGDPYPGVAHQMSLTDFARNLGDEHVKAWLIRPDKSFKQVVNEDAGGAPVSEEESGYPERWEAMRKTVVKILPKIAEPGRWNTHSYVPVTKEQYDSGVLKRTTRGRVLLKFDPQHVPEVLGTSRGSSRKAGALLKLWMEEQELLSEAWTPT